MHGETTSRRNRRGFHFEGPLITLFLAACSPIAAPTYFVPPTRGAAPAEVSGSPVAATASPVVEPSTPPIQASPSPPPACSDDLDYLQDLTIPDGSVMAPGETIDKRWQVRNSGSCNWDQRYSLRLISGDAMGSDGSIALYPARSGAEATLQAVFTAPQESGTYECQWQAANPDGTPFGDAFYMQIVVGG